MQSETAWTGSGLLAPIGRLDAAAAPSLLDELTALLDEDYSHLVVNLADVHYVSSSVLRVLLMARKRALEAGGDVILCCLQPQVRHVINMVGFDRIFTICESEEDAQQRGISKQATARAGEDKQ